jgi:hypothetical protein
VKRKKKAFDCVEMKNRIQAKLRREEAKYGPEEAAKRRWQRVMENPILAKFVQTHPPTNAPEAAHTKRIAGRRP